MKAALVAATLTSIASATPIVITYEGPFHPSPLTPSEIIANLKHNTHHPEIEYDSASKPKPNTNGHGESELRILPMPLPFHSELGQGEVHKPCPGKGMRGGPLGAMLSRLGLGFGGFGRDGDRDGDGRKHHGDGNGNHFDGVEKHRPEHGHEHEYTHTHGKGEQHEVKGGEEHEVKAGEEDNLVIAAWKHFIDEAIGKGNSDAFVPLMQGGVVTLPAAFESPPSNPQIAEGKVHPYGGAHHGRPHRFQHHHESFELRLRRALTNLSQLETLLFAIVFIVGLIVTFFVIGAGLGSMLCLCFAIPVLLIRRLVPNKANKAKREALRQKNLKQRQNRAARKADTAAAAAAEKEAEVAMYVNQEGGEAEIGMGMGEVLPSYAEDEGDRLVEKI